MSDTTATADNSLPALSTWTVSATGNFGVFASFPALSTWVIGAAGNAGNYADNSFPALSAWTLESVGSGDGVADLTAPLFGLEAAATFGRIATAEVVVPRFTLEAHDGSVAELELRFELSASAIAGAAGSADMVAHAAVLAADASSDNAASANITLLRPSLVAGALAENTGVVDGSLRPLRVSATGVVGYAGVVDITLLAPVLTAAANQSNTGTAELSHPGWYSEAQALIAVIEAYRAWALNVRSAALTEYTGMPFNSFAVFGGRVLAASANGLHVVGESDTDNGAAIAARVRTAATDFGTSYNKRVPRAYVGMKASADMEFRTVTSFDGVRAYLIQHNGNGEIQQRRAPIGRGPKARFWQFELANRDGGDFTVADVQAYPEVYGRRVV